MTEPEPKKRKLTKHSFDRFCAGCNERVCSVEDCLHAEQTCIRCMRRVCYDCWLSWYFCGGACNQLAMRIYQETLEEQLPTDLADITVSYLGDSGIRLWVPFTSWTPARREWCDNNRAAGVDLHPNRPRL